jgi:hypothetical protein
MYLTTLWYTHCKGVDQTSNFDSTMDPSAHHLDHSTSQQTSQQTHVTQPHACLHTPTELISSAHQDRADWACTHPIPRDSTIFHCRSVILLYRHQFYYYELNHFSRVNSAILLDNLKIFAQSFCYSELNHYCYSARSFFNCYRSHLFLIATVFGLFWLMQCSIIFLLLQCSVILCCYSAHSFSTTAMLNHSSYYNSQSFLFCYNAQPFRVATCTWPLSHFAKWPSGGAGQEVARGSFRGTSARLGEGWLTGPSHTGRAHGLGVSDLIGQLDFWVIHTHTHTHTHTQTVSIYTTCVERPLWFST